MTHIIIITMSNLPRFILLISSCRSKIQSSPLSPAHLDMCWISTSMWASRNALIWSAPSWTPCTTCVACQIRCISSENMSSNNSIVIQYILTIRTSNELYFPNRILINSHDVKSIFIYFAANVRYLRQHSGYLGSWICREVIRSTREFMQILNSLRWPW